jgi:hypothetical protein
VKLTFDGIPERLVIPFAALKVFFDPSVRYGLQFESPDLDAETIVPPQETQEEAAPADSQPVAFRGSPRPVAERKPARAQRKPRVDRSGEQAGAAEAGSLRAVPAKPPPRPESKPEEPAAEPAVALAPEPAAPSAEIVRLDAFRKK